MMMMRDGNDYAALIIVVLAFLTATTLSNRMLDDG